MINSAFRKKSFVFLVLFLQSIKFFSQGEPSIALIGEYSENFSVRNYSGGLQVEIPIKDWVSVNYKATIGASSDKAFYFHSPIGAAFGTYLGYSLLASSSGSGSKGIGMLCAIMYAIPEGITFYPNPKGKVRVGIYVSPLGCDYWKKRHEYEYFKFSGEAGAKFRYPLGDGKVDLMGYGGLKYVYTKKFYQVEPLFLNAGFGLSFNLD